MRTAQELNSLALRTRRLWNEDGYSPIDIFAIVNGWKDKKITIVRYPLSSRISGMCTKEKDDIVICINSTTSYGRQRFTLAHELYHVLYEEGMQRVICDMSMNGNKSDSEKEADQFASYLLMPYDALLEYEHNKGKWDLEKVIDAEQFFQVSHQEMLHRLVLIICSIMKLLINISLLQFLLWLLNWDMVKNYIFRQMKKSNISQQVNIFVKLKRWQKKVLFRKVKRKNF